MPRTYPAMMPYAKGIAKLRRSGRSLERPNHALLDSCEPICASRVCHWAGTCLTSPLSARGGATKHGTWIPLRRQDTRSGACA